MWNFWLFMKNRWILQIGLGYTGSRSQLRCYLTWSVFEIEKCFCLHKNNVEFHQKFNVSIFNMLVVTHLLIPPSMGSFKLLERLNIHGRLRTRTLHFQFGLYVILSAFGQIYFKKGLVVVKYSYSPVFHMFLMLPLTKLMRNFLF